MSSSFQLFASWLKIFGKQKPRLQLTCLSIAASVFITISLFQRNSSKHSSTATDYEFVSPSSPFHPSTERNFTFPFCKCTRLGLEIESPDDGGLPSACSDYATSRGPGQKVVSYSYFGDSQAEGTRRKYFSQIRVRAEEIKRLYPDWIMRVYFDTGEDDFEGILELCDMWCELQNVDFCEAKNLPKPFGDLKNLQPIGTYEMRRRTSL